MTDRMLLRLSATLLFIGQLVAFVLDFLHPSSGGAGTNQTTFAAYAGSSDYAAIHLGQFASTAVLLAGLLVLFFALGVSQGAPRWLGVFGAIAAGVTMALEGVQMAVDGVALKQAVDAWVSAPAAEQATRFASAQAIRWLETGAASYWNFMQGLALVLFALVIVWTARVTRPIGSLMGVSGLAFIGAGWVFGTEGFMVTSGGLLQAAGYTFLFALTIWLLIVAWRRKESVQAAPA